MNSIRHHLVIRLLLWLGVLCFVAITAFLAASKASLEADFDRSLIPQLSNARLLLRPGPLGFNHPANRDEEIFIQAWDFDTGNTLYKSPTLGRRNLPFREVSPRRTGYWDASLEDGEPVRIAATGILTLLSSGSDATGNPVVLAVAKNRRPLEIAVRNRTLLAIGIGVSGSFMAAMIAWWTLRRGLKPLDHLSEQVDTIGSESLAARLETAALPSELAPFAKRINDLLERLETAFERERRFGADLSHELRTPIAEIRSTAEFATLYPARAGEEDFDSILKTTEKLQSIVETQLELARLETAVLAENTREVDLVALLQSEWEACEATAAARKLRLSQSGPDELCFATHPDILRTVLANLLSNAVDYAPEGSEVRIEIEEGEPSPTIRISNPAPELSDEDLPRLFERLWRKDSARSDSRHAGLGLSLSKTAAARIGLSLSAELQEDRLQLRLDPLKDEN